jgi:hypothetical protein
VGQWRSRVGGPGKEGPAPGPRPLSTNRIEIVTALLRRIAIWQPALLAISVYQLSRPLRSKRGFV